MSTSQKDDQVMEDTSKQETNTADLQSPKGSQAKSSADSSSSTRKTRSKNKKLNSQKQVQDELNQELASVSKNSKTIKKPKKEKEQKPPKDKKEKKEKIEKESKPKSPAKSEKIKSKSKSPKKKVSKKTKSDFSSDGSQDEQYEIDKNISTDEMDTSDKTNSGSKSKTSKSGTEDSIAKNKRGRKATKKNEPKKEKQTAKTIEQAIKSFNLGEKETGYKEHIREIKQKIMDTSETSDESVQLELENANKQVSIIEDWDQNYSSVIVNTDQKSESDTSNQNSDLANKLQNLLIETIVFEAKSDLMVEGFDLYEQNKEWIKESENFIDARNRKMNSLVSEESLNTLKKSLETIKEKLDDEDNKGGIQKQMLQSRKEILNWHLEQINNFSEDADSVIKAEIKEDTAEQMKELYTKQKTMIIKPQQAKKIKNILLCLKWINGETTSNKKKLVAYDAFKNDSADFNFDADLKIKLQQKFDHIDSHLNSKITKYTNCIKDCQSGDNLFEALDSHHTNSEELNALYKLDFKKLVIDHSLIYNYFKKLNGAFTKQKLEQPKFDLSDNNSIWSAFKTLKKASLSTLIIKDEAELKTMCEQCKHFEAFYNTLKTYVQKAECDEAANQKSNLKKLKQLVSTAEANLAKGKGNESQLDILKERLKKANEWYEKFKELQLNDANLRQALKDDYQKIYNLSQDLSSLKEQLNLDLSSEENKQFNKVKKWSNTVNQAHMLINKQHKYEDIDVFNELITQIQVCKLLAEVEVVSQLKTELEKIKQFQTQIEQLWDAIPQDKQAIQDLMAKTKGDLKINYDIEFDAIQEQFDHSLKWDQKVQEILDSPFEKQLPQMSKVQEYLKEIIDDDDNQEMKFGLVTQQIYDDLRILYVKLLVENAKNNQTNAIDFYEQIKEEIPSQVDDESDLSVSICGSSTGGGSKTLLTMALNSKANDDHDMSQEEQVKPVKKRSNLSTPKKESGNKKSSLSGKLSSCKKKMDQNPKIKELLQKEILLMDLSKKVHEYTKNNKPNKDKDVEMTDESNKESDEMQIDSHVKKDQDQQAKTNQLMTKKHQLTYDEASNIVNNRKQLPFLIDDKDHDVIKNDLDIYDDLKNKSLQLQLLEECPEISEYDDLLVKLNELVFDSPSLKQIRSIYENCTFILQMSLQFIPNQLPSQSVSKFINNKFINKKDSEGKETSKPKEYQMFETEFKHIGVIIEKGLKFKCEQANELQSLYQIHKASYDKCKESFNEIRNKPIDEITFKSLGRLSKGLSNVKMNFESDERQFKKDLWFFKMTKLVRNYQHVKLNLTDEEKKKEMGEHRLHSDYVRVLYDEAVELNVASSNHKRKQYTIQTSAQQSQINENNTSINYNNEEAQKHFDKLTDILEDVELIHRYVRMCASNEELQEFVTNEDQQVLDFRLRIETQTKEIQSEDNKEKYKNQLEDEKRIKPHQQLMNLRNCSKKARKSKYYQDNTDEASFENPSSSISNDETHDTLDNASTATSQIKKKTKATKKKIPVKKTKSIEKKEKPVKEKKSAPIKLKKEKSASPPKKTKLTESQKEEQKKDAANKKEADAARKRDAKANDKLKKDQEKEAKEKAKNAETAMKERPSTAPGMSPKVLELKARLKANLERKALEAKSGKGTACKLDIVMKKTPSKQVEQKKEEPKDDDEESQDSKGKTTPIKKPVLAKRPAPSIGGSKIATPTKKLKTVEEKNDGEDKDQTDNTENASQQSPVKLKIGSGKSSPAAVKASPIGKSTPVMGGGLKMGGLGIKKKVGALGGLGGLKMGGIKGLK